MEARDLEESDRIFRLAFGTFIGLPDPSAFMGDKDLVATRWHGRTAEGIVAEMDGKLVGSNMITRWGKFAFFGPLTVRPDLWDSGIAKALLASTVEILDRWGVTDAGLFTFPHSAKHAGLYQKFGFWPGHLTALMSKPVSGPAGGWTGYSNLSEPDRKRALTTCRALTGSIHPGLDLSIEIESVFNQKLGETVLLLDDGDVDAFAVCHSGRGTEGGSDNCYVKFAACRGGPGAAARLASLLFAVESWVASRGAHRIEVGVNTGRLDAYREMLALGFRTNAHGIAMHRPKGPGYNREDVWTLDDWR